MQKFAPSEMKFGSTVLGGGAADTVVLAAPAEKLESNPDALEDDESSLLMFPAAMLVHEVQFVAAGLIKPPRWDCRY